MDEELVFSKAFAISMRPSKIIPYYYKASGPFSQGEVTVTSIITSDRLDVFARLVEKYKGAMTISNISQWSSTESDPRSDVGHVPRQEHNGRGSSYSGKASNYLRIFRAHVSIR
jgi:hypothetical protein